MNDEERIRVLEGTVAQLERKVDFLIQHLGITYTEQGPTADPVIVEHLRRGEMIQAIKRYRDLTRAGLAEAKQAVEAIDADLKATQHRPPYR